MFRTVRPLLAGRRGRLAGVLLVLTIIAGVVVMHAMSGSSTRHGGHHGAVAVVAEHHAPSHAATAAAADVVDDTGSESAGCGTTGCGGHEVVTAMCLMILAVLLALVGPGARALLRVEGPRGAPWHALTAASRPALAPSLHALGISRT